MAYRLVTFQSGGEARAGLLVDEQVYDAARASGNPAYATVLGILQDWGKAKGALAETARRISAGRSRAQGTPVKRAKLLAPLPNPGNIFCAGANYKDHVAEMNRALHGNPDGPTMKDLGEQPWHFIKTGASSVVGPGAKVKIPPYCKAMDWEIELVAVIGRKGKDLPVGKALGIVAGWTIANDLSARDASKRGKLPATSAFHFDWLGQKCFDGSCPLGPVIVPASEIKDPHNLDMKLWVNDDVMQDSNTGKMIFDTAEQIAMLSSRVTLQPGDLVLTGTPAGVGAGRKLFLKQGDRLKLWIDQIGELSHTMV